MVTFLKQQYSWLFLCALFNPNAKEISSLATYYCQFPSCIYLSHRITRLNNNNKLSNNSNSSNNNNNSKLRLFSFTLVCVP
jgi:hypothetical protein